MTVVFTILCAVTRVFYRFHCCSSPELLSSRSPLYAQRLCSVADYRHYTHAREPSGLASAILRAGACVYNTSGNGDAKYDEGQ